MRRHIRLACVFLILWSPAARVAAQTGTGAGEPDSNPLPAQDVPPQSSDSPEQQIEHGLKLFIKDVGRDYRNTFSKETAIWYGAGLGTAGLVHLVDEDISEALADPGDHTFMKPGDLYGNLAFQFPLAAGWWAAGCLLGNARAADVGRDLLRAQINSTTWTYAIKFAVGRERPNGDQRSFPSGHAASSFATAMVLQEHYGWKVGAPFFIAAGYTAATRIAKEKHWASDIFFGAAIGMASARTVTLHLRNKKVTLVPMAAPGGAGLALVILD